jgi:N-acetylmuramoyl-L-alanine amidase
MSSADPTDAARLSEAGGQTRIAKATEAGLLKYFSGA